MVTTQTCIIRHRQIDLLVLPASNKEMPSNVIFCKRGQPSRSGEWGNRQLMVIPIPPGGYTVNYLKTTLASAKGHLRPFQKDITPVLDHGNVAGSVQSQVSCSFLVF